MSLSPHFLAIIKTDVVKNNFLKQLESQFATCDIIDRLENLSDIPKYTQYHGIIYDLKSIFQLSRLDRAFLKLYAADLPMLKFVWNPKNDEMLVTYSSLDDGKENDLNSFVKKCSLHPARAIRRELRYNINLNALLDKHKVNINNISKQGCYVLTTLSSFKTGDKVDLVVNEFNDDTPILCLINRVVEWGNNDLAAGIGLEFISMTKIQRTVLDSILSDCETKMEKDLEDDTY